MPPPIVVKELHKTSFSNRNRILVLYHTALNDFSFSILSTLRYLPNENNHALNIIFKNHNPKQSLNYQHLSQNLPICFATKNILRLKKDSKKTPRK